MKISLLILLSLCISLNCFAFGMDIPATFMTLSPDETAVQISGPLEHPDEKQLLQMVELFRALPATVKTVHLEVQGGRLDIALDIAAIIKKRGMNTFSYTSCISACTFMFQAGKERLVDKTTYFVFHKIKYLVANVHKPKDPKIAVLEAYWQGRATQSYIDNGLDKEFAYRIQETPEISKHAEDLNGLDLWTDLKDMSIEGNKPEYNFSKGKVIFGGSRLNF